MNPFKHTILEQPDDEQYLWRYIKAERIQSFLDGNLYFAPLIEFDDWYEAVTPLHYFMHKFLKTSLSLDFDLSKPFKEIESSETVLGTLLMWVGIYDMQKKLSMLTGITDHDELSKKLMEYCENMNQFITPHVAYQNTHYTSCWFVGEYIESALMWTSYSQPGGIAVRIKFSDFKKIISEYFERFSDPFETYGVRETYAGLIKYKDFNDATEWFKDIDAGVPLPFFKQHFYKQENEFRVIIEREKEFPSENYQRLNKVFANDTPFQIILHPTAGPDDLMEIKNKIKGSKFLKVSLSDMDFNYVRDKQAQTPF